MAKWVLCFSCVLLFLHFSFAQQSKCDTVTEQDYYDFFNSTVNPFPVTTMGSGCNPDNLKIGNLISLPEANALKDDTTEIFADTLFTVADKAFIHKQMLQNRTFRWKAGKMNDENVIDGDKVRQLFNSATRDSAWGLYIKKYKMGYNQFSVPLFSCNKVRCIVYRGYECTANYGLGNTNVFEKKGDKWVIVKSCSPWVH
jgi:hypothetical protein